MLKCSEKDFTQQSKDAVTIKQSVSLLSTFSIYSRAFDLIISGKFFEKKSLELFSIFSFDSPPMIDLIKLFFIFSVFANLSLTKTKRGIKRMN